MVKRFCSASPIPVSSKIEVKGFAVQQITDGKTGEALCCLLSSGLFPREESDLVYLSNLLKRTYKAYLFNLIDYDELSREENRVTRALIDLLSSKDFDA